MSSMRTLLVTVVVCFALAATVSASLSKAKAPTNGRLATEGRQVPPEIRGSVRPNPLAALLSGKGNFPFKMVGGENGAGTCAGCTLIVGLLEQAAQIHNSSIDKEMEKLCSYLPDPFGSLCSDFFKIFGPTIIDLIEDGATADVVCNAITLCKDQTAVCRLFPPPISMKGKSELEYRLHIHSLRAKYEPVLAPMLKDIRDFNICTILPEVCLVEDHLPAFDVDGDYFSTYTTLRGTYWRGTDCNDLDDQVFPGRDSNDASTDNNCNGIFGVDPATGVTYEDQWCKGTGAMGVGILGDSATAHFRIPPGWVTAADLSWEDFSGVIRDAEDELDWPMFSWSTGHLNTSSFGPDISGPVDSVYLNLRRINECNNNDFQNMGVNGARAENLLPFAKLLGRTILHSPVPVKPMILFMAMIGNDVCGSEQHISHFTPVDQYHEQVKAAVLYADTILPPGSKIVLVGLADGRILYDSMHNRIHPIGETNQDVTYKDLYDFLNCLHISPCWGWMNSNGTIRNETSAHAAALSDELPKIVAETMGMLNNTQVIAATGWTEAIKMAPYPSWQLIEPVDGFHPSQLGNFLLAQYFNNITKAAGFLPAENPNNAAIRAKFGKP